MRMLCAVSILCVIACIPEEDSKSKEKKCSGNTCQDKPVECEPCGSGLLCQPGTTNCVKASEVYVPLRDDVELHTQVILPQGDGPFPVVLLRTAYWQLGGNAGIDAFQVLVDEGYAFVYQSVRGTGNSQGVLDPLGQEFDDGEDVAEWIVQQPWCNGRIGTLGGSYEGYAAMAAALRSPHIKVVLPDGYLSSAYKTWPATHNGVPGWTLLWWLHLVRTNNDLLADFEKNSLSTNHRPYTTLDQAILGETDALWQQMVPHMDQDTAPWRRWSFDDQLGNFCTPVLLLEAATEWEDDVLDDFLSLQAGACSASEKRAQRFVLGAHDHSGAIYNPMGTDPASQLIQKYLQTFLKQEEVGLDDEPTVHYYVQQAGAWGTADSWPVATSQAVFHLHGDAPRPYEGELLGQSPTSDTALSYTFDPQIDDACSNSSAGVLTYFSQPIATPAALVGRARLDLQLQIDTPDTDIFVYLFEVLNGDQTWNLITMQAQRLRHRASFTQPELVTPDQPFALTMEMVASGYQLAAGAKVVVLIASSECGSQENPNTGESTHDAVQTQPVRVQVLSGPQNPSTLTLPLVEL